MFKFDLDTLAYVAFNVFKNREIRLGRRYRYFAVDLFDSKSERCSSYAPPALLLHSHDVAVQQPAPFFAYRFIPEIYEQSELDSVPATLATPASLLLSSSPKTAKHGLVEETSDAPTKRRKIDPKIGSLEEAVDQLTDSAAPHRLKSETSDEPVTLISTSVASAPLLIETAPSKHALSDDISTAPAKLVKIEEAPPEQSLVASSNLSAPGSSPGTLSNNKRKALEDAVTTTKSSDGRDSKRQKQKSVRPKSLADVESKELFGTFVSGAENLMKDSKLFRDLERLLRANQATRLTDGLFFLFKDDLSEQFGRAWQGIKTFKGGKVSAMLYRKGVKTDTHLAQQLLAGAC